MIPLLGNQAAFTIRVDGIPPLPAPPRVLRFSGHEGISELYEFNVEILAGELELASLLGAPATLQIDGLEGERLVHGEIAEIEYVGRTKERSLYELSLVPPLWRLGQRQSSRIFQEMTTPAVIQAVLKDAGLPGDGLRLDLVADYGVRDYCVQYHETDLAFISRLMEEDGIFYFFEHGPQGVVMVLGDDPGAHPKTPGPPLWFNPGGEVLDQEHVTELRVAEGILPGKVSFRDFNFKLPEETLDVDAVSKVGDPDLEVYDYPGEYQEARRGAPHHGETMAAIRLEALDAARRRITGGSDSRRLTPGYTCTILGHPRVDLSGELLMTRVTHHGTQPQALEEYGGGGAFHYSNTFTCIDAKVPFRPQRRTPRPVVQGVQSATVVGAGDEEVHCDDQGRVLVHFHWDRRDLEGKTGEDLASCWVRVSQLWAGSGWGSIFLPRVGHEVLVDFIEGDPDRPIITGRVYHANNPLPYPLPEEKTKSAIKSDSSPGGGGFNELRFEDRKGSEEVFLHAQKDLNEVVLNNNSRNVGVNQCFSIGGDQTFSVSGNQSFSITKDRSVTVSEGDESLTVTLGKSTTTVKEDRSVTVEVGDSSLTVATGSHTATVKKAITAKSTNSSVDLKAHTSLSLTAETAGITAEAKAGVKIEAQTAGLEAIAKETVAIRSRAASLRLSAPQEVSLVSTNSTLSLVSLEPTSVTSGKAVAISAPLGVDVHGGTYVQIGAQKVVITGEEEVTIQVGTSSITLKPDGIELSASKITSTAVGLHVISGALIRIN